MSILTRFTDIMSSNINALLDKAEDPEKMVDQTLRNLEKDLGTVKAETAAVMAAEQQAKRSVDTAQEKVDKYMSYAKKAVDAGNDDDARKFLAKKNEAAAELESAQKTYEVAKNNAANIRKMHDKLVNDVDSLNKRRNEVKAKMAVAKTQEKINKIGTSMKGATTSLDTFSRMEAKADEMLDKANAMAELNYTAADETEDLMDKYDSSTSVESELAAMKSSDVEAELAALKAGSE